MPTNKGTLYLIPTIIADDTEQLVLPPSITRTLSKLQFFLAENPRTTRRFFSKLRIFPSIEALTIEQVDKDTSVADIEKLMQPLVNGADMGVLSESGCPGVADPGSLAAAYAHRAGARVIPLVGPSSILLALMASGLSGQNFSFHGYLPVDANSLSQTLKSLEKESRTQDRTQIFIETPYRNNGIFGQIVKALQPLTRLCIAVDITGANEFIRMQTVQDWRRAIPDLPKSPCVFLFQA